MRKYTHFGPRDRALIAQKLNRDGLSISVTATHLGVSKSALSYEIKRNRVQVTEHTRKTGRVNGKPLKIFAGRYMYDPEYAQQAATKRARRGRQRVADTLTKLTPGSRLFQAVAARLQAGFKPDVIAGRLRLEYPDDESMRVSHETIYQGIYQHPEWGWAQYLERDRPQRKRRSSRRSPIKDRVSIRHRAEDVETRSTFGHWEGDTVVGHASNPSKHVLVTLTERKTRKLTVARSCDKSSPNVIDAVIDMLSRTPAHALTLTVDNGSEFAGHARITHATQTRVFFADPYSSYQRGTNERHNGLLRKFFPKGTDFANVTDDEITEAVAFWNNYPRKILGYRTPNEAWEEETPAASPQASTPESYTGSKPTGSVLHTP